MFHRFVGVDLRVTWHDHIWKPKYDGPVRGQCDSHPAHQGFQRFFQPPCAVKHKVATLTGYALFPDRTHFALSGIGDTLKGFFAAVAANRRKKSRRMLPAFAFVEAGFSSRRAFPSRPEARL
jgi:hypothetical protein